MDLDKWLEWYTNTDSLDNAFNDDYWNKRIYHEDGRLDGIEEGKEQNSIEIAKKMLKNNIAINEISKYTNISIKKLKEIKEELDENK